MNAVYITGGKVRFQLSQPQGATRTREAVGQLLQVNHVCLLLGAGASFHLGAPRIRGVDVPEAQAMCIRAGVELGAEGSALLQYLMPKPVDLEDLMGRLGAVLAYASASGLDEIDVGGYQTKRIVVSELLESLNASLAKSCDLPNAAGTLVSPFDTDPWLSHRELFRRILAARRPNSPRVRVFTTNYDTAIECALDHSNIHYFDGFVGGLSRSFDLSSYQNDLYRLLSSGQARFRQVHDVLLLYKLHGSINWRVTEVAAGPLTGATIVQSSTPPGPGNLAVIYPTVTKEMDILGHPYADLLREFGTALAEPECVLIVVGFGFGDRHINRLIHQALLFNSTLQLLVVDPSGVFAEDDMDHEAERLDTEIGRLSSITDPRISVLTGPEATFAAFSELLPDITERTSAERQATSSDLAAALLRPEAAQEPES